MKAQLKDILTGLRRNAEELDSLAAKLALQGRAAEAALALVQRETIRRACVPIAEILDAAEMAELREGQP